MVLKPETYPSLAVANYFIQQSQKTGVSLTPMKLLKLVYIAHGWSLALFDKALISEIVQAWEYGPVVPDIYHTFRRYGANQIADMAQVATDGEIIIPMIKADDVAARALLDKVWQGYAHLDGRQLSTITHEPNTPWSDTWAKHGKNATIPQDSIQAHYKELANARRATVAA
jgi:uncharacterized phage-associated protein